MVRMRWQAVVVLLCVLAAPALGQGQERRGQRQGDPRRDPAGFTMLREEGFPLNVDPEIVGAQDAELGAGDMVMGIVINGEARAYPVNYMNGPFNEVVNDHLGGQAIAPSW